VAVFQRACSAQGNSPLHITVADYNPSVLYLATLPNFLLAWALQQGGGGLLPQEALGTEGELELLPEVKQAFATFLQTSGISLAFVSGGWSPEFVSLLYHPTVITDPFSNSSTLVIGAETIYSPFALGLFTETLLSILRRERQERSSCQAMAIIAAKRLYFGVGGSLDDFVDKMRSSDAMVETLREETEGVRRGVVQCLVL
jgi:protein-histidine N-methyltransferase